jgi:phosphatidylethanolamine/phosphatidyl-N-methylethanolamine N-methyltransferase
MNFDFVAFAACWLRAPTHVGAVTPSGAALAKAMAAQVDPQRPGHVIELGGGTGAVTAALLERGVARSRLVVVERDPLFCRLLRQRFPGLLILKEDASEVARVLAGHGIHEVSAVVSSLPLLSLGPSVQAKLLKRNLDLIGSAGGLTQFTYGLGSPIRSGVLEESGMSGQPVARVWRNLPPATVWQYSHCGQEQGAGL